MTKFGAMLREALCADPPEVAAAAREALLARARAFDAMFRKLAALSTASRADHPAASARYARLVLRAQARCREAFSGLR